MEELLIHSTKRQNGQFYTIGNPFLLRPFLSWVEENQLRSEEILEPFAGANNIIRALQEVGMAEDFSSYDIHPNNTDVERRDTLQSFPVGFEVCVTNPPWLAKNSARRRRLEFPTTPYDDLYKHSLHLCLENCRYVAALIPATFLQSEEFRARLHAVVFLHEPGMFSDTENPVCLALFNDTLTPKIAIFNDNHFVGYLHELERELPQKRADIDLVFNHPEGQLGFIAFDNTREPSIHFCEGSALEDYKIGFSTRMITRIEGNFGDLSATIGKLNEEIEKFRRKTDDVFLTPFKGLRKDGKYRRRMDYRLARKFIEAYA